MNTRLQNLYSSIEKSNEADFLNNEVELDKTWGKAIWGVTLQIDLGTEVKDKLVCYQQKLDELELNNLLLLPREYQHISFNQVVFWGGEYKLGNEKTWDSISKEFIKAFKKMDKRYSAFQIKFSQLIATTGGIIWCGYDENDELEKLREEFLQRLPFPEETTKFNHIIHTTVARYKSKLNAPKTVLSMIKKQTDSVLMTVNKIILRKELVFPSIKTKEIAQIELV
jgi:hypothetical protein